MIDYGTIVDDFVAAVSGADLGFKTVLANANDTDYIFDKMPLLDVRVKAVDPQPVTNTTYYSDLTLEAEIVVFDMTNRREAAKLRDNLTNALQSYVKENPRFSSSLETTFVGRGDFGTGESKADGAFVAGVVLEFHPKLYTE